MSGRRSAIQYSDMSLLRSISFFLLAFGVAAQAAEIPNPTPSARALGMGNAYIGTVDDIESLLFNPASLAKVHGIQVHIMGVEGAAKNLTDYTDLTNLQNSKNIATALPALYGKNYYYGAGANTGVAVPMFGAMMYNYLNASLQIANPPVTEIDANILNDYGYAVGFGVPLGPFVQFGAVGRYIKRSGTQNNYGAASLASLNMNQVTGDIYSWGTGYELDTGANFFLPEPFFHPEISVVWQNIGTTTFKQAPTNHIPSIPADLVVGLAAEMNFPFITVRPEVDYTHITEDDIQLFRKFNFGVEISLPLIDIRAGYSEGYYAYGLGVSFGPIRVDAASYGVELGDYPGQIEDRRYMAQVTIELDVGGFGVDQKAEDAAKNSKGGKNGSGAAGSGSRSIWGSDRLKERR